ncbi:MAG: HPr family phosphocarrier protein [Cellulomonadaceae bacterium]|jgi:PTS hybrid protein|nr:HPr family phosphocarrier protein [Cellulomonadaceae bacterium]
MTAAPVAIVLVSHSAALAAGAAQLAGQMAPDVHCIGCGGLADGSLGTIIDPVETTIGQALDSAASVVVLADPGSAVMTVETAIDLHDEWAGRVLLARAPFVEGAVAAAVAAQAGGTLDAVNLAATQASHMWNEVPSGMSPQGEQEGSPDRRNHPADDATDSEPDSDPDSDPDGDTVTGTVAVPNPLGLHARPAAVVARHVSAFGVPTTINGADASSVLMLMALEARQGHTLTVTATGDRAQQAVDSVIDLISAGFGEI